MSVSVVSQIKSALLRDGKVGHARPDETTPEEVADWINENIAACFLFRGNSVYLKMDDGECFEQCVRQRNLEPRNRIGVPSAEAGAEVLLDAEPISIEYIRNPKYLDW